MPTQYTYTNRAVAFLDVLGFQNKLIEFEREAINFRNAIVESDDAQNPDDPISSYFSRKASDFIETFESAISKLDKQKFNYYLFSDNICITANTGNGENEQILTELLLVIAELFFEFVKKGYFIRGGIDYGLFIDQSSIALGVPLAVAYKLESTQAVYPRIILSSSFIEQFEVYSANSPTAYPSLLVDSLIKRSCEISYLNVFNHIFKTEEKEDFFEKYSQNISENIFANLNKESVFIKYQWLANEFNSFLDTYSTSLVFYDENFEATTDYISSIQNLKISYGQ
jgi:hypothetical protein